MPDEAPVTIAVLRFMISSLPRDPVPRLPSRWHDAYTAMRKNARRSADAIRPGAQRSDAPADPGGSVAPLSGAWRRGRGPREDHGGGRLDGRHLLHALRLEGGAAPGNSRAHASGAA